MSVQKNTVRNVDGYIITLSFSVKRELPNGYSAPITKEELAKLNSLQNLRIRIAASDMLLNIYSNLLPGLGHLTESANDSEYNPPAATPGPSEGTD